VFNGAVRMAIRGPFRIVPRIVGFLPGLCRLQSQLRALGCRIRGARAENPLIDEARVAGAILFVARKPQAGRGIAGEGLE